MRVRSTDQGGLFTEKAFTITVTGVNEAPTDLSLTGSQVAENMASGTLIGSFAAVDPDAGDSLTYSLVTGVGSTDNASVRIIGTELRTATAFDFETRNSYSIRVRASDAGGIWIEKHFTIGITDSGDAFSTVFGFKHVNQTGADDYLIDSTEMRKYSEWQSPPITYWGPSANNTEGRLIYRLPVTAGATSLRLLAHSPSWDFFNEPGGSGRGASSLEVSADGLTWTTLRDSLQPRQWGADWTYDDFLPPSVLGRSDLYVRMRFLVE